MPSYSASASPDSDGAAMAKATIVANTPVRNLILFQMIVVRSQKVEWSVSSFISRFHTVCLLWNAYEYVTIQIS